MIYETNHNYVELVKWWGGLMPQTILVLIQNLKKSCLACSSKALLGMELWESLIITLPFLYMTYDTYSNNLKESSRQIILSQVVNNI